MRATPPPIALPVAAAVTSVLTVVLALLAIPSAALAERWLRPVPGEVARAFHFSRGAPFAAGAHRGADLAAPPGTAVRAACAGTVAFAGARVRPGRRRHAALRRSPRHAPAARVDRGPRRHATPRRCDARHARAGSRRPPPRRPRGGRPVRLRRPARVPALAGPPTHPDHRTPAPWSSARDPRAAAARAARGAPPARDAARRRTGAPPPDSACRRAGCSGRSVAGRRRTTVAGLGGRGARAVRRRRLRLDRRAPPPPAVGRGPPRSADVNPALKGARAGLAIARLRVVVGMRAELATEATRRRGRRRVLRGVVVAHSATGTQRMPCGGGAGGNRSLCCG